MAPSLAELIAALPEPTASDEGREAGLPIPDVALRPVPIGRWQRITALGTLQAKIAAAYLFHWLRGWFRSADEQQRLLAETHWRTAVRVLDSMTYLRGAVAKVGQTLGNFPSIVPREFVETLDQLHFDAPPMHWSLLREMVHNELGGDPRDFFASFDGRAFAAASLGQVHRARLASGDEVAIKIQYPGIARTIGADMRNLILFLVPARWTRDWDNIQAQLEDIRFRLEEETDYVREAETLDKVRALFHESEGIQVPRVIRQFCTPRVLTMEFAEGVHLEEYLAGQPTQEERNEVAQRLVRAWYRMMYRGRLLYLDFHPGNFLFQGNGRIALIDFGSMIFLDDELWTVWRKMDRALTTGAPEDRREANRLWCELTSEELGGDREKIMDDYADWCWRSRYCGGVYDFGDDADFREGVDLFIKMIERRYSRARPCTPMIARSQFGWRSILYRLRAKIDVAAIAEEEVKATGWDRRDYASQLPA